MTPKRGPRSTPKRTKIDVKIEIDLDAKTKRAGQGLGFRLWVDLPPPLGGAPGTQGRRPRHHGTALLGLQALVDSTVHSMVTYISRQYKVYSIQHTV